MTREQATKLGKAYDAYIRFRAQKEGVRYELTPEFFEAGLMSGCSCFFGVSYAADKLTEDFQFPEFFEQWKELHWSVGALQSKELHQNESTTADSPDGHQGL
jgi:hypothetical protein